jgi:C4-dicarboxylate transporter, DctQ subunit
MSVKNILKKITDIIHIIEDSILVFFLSLIIIITFLQIVLRTFFRSVEWFDLLVRYSVLWIGLLAAGIATYKSKHIKIDIIGRFAKGRLKSLTYLITNLFASIISLILSYSSYIYLVKIEMTANDPAPFLNIPRWFLLIIIPLGFGFIGFRFLLKTAVNLYDFIKNTKNVEEEEYT